MGGGKSETFTNFVADLQFVYTDCINCKTCIIIHINILLTSTNDCFL